MSTTIQGFAPKCYMVMERGDKRIIYEVHVDQTEIHPDFMDIATDDGYRQRRIERHAPRVAIRG